MSNATHGMKLPIRRWKRIVHYPMLNEPRKDIALPQGSKRWWWLAVCLLSPAVAGVVRKLVPGQPNFIDAAPTGLVLLVALGVIVRRNRAPFPDWVAAPLLFWGVAQVLFAVMSVFEDWRIGVASIMIRVVPMLLAVISFDVVGNWEDLARISRLVCSLGPLLLPVGLIVAFLGNGVLPVWLQPVEIMTELGKDARDGIPVPSAVFTSNGMLALSMLAILFLALTNAAVAKIRKKNTAGWWWIGIAAFILIYLTGRRGVLIGAVIGLGVFSINYKQLSRQVVVGLLAAMAVLILVDVQGLNLGRSYQVRSELAVDLDFYERVVDVFIPFLFFWIKTTPLGNYLGFTGPEARGFGVVAFRSISSVVEVGGAQLAAEMGIFGALFMPITVASSVWMFYRRSRSLQCRHAIYTLLVFQIVVFIIYYMKELAALSNVSIAQFLFWAAPGICAAIIQQEIAGSADLVHSSENSFEK